MFHQRSGVLIGLAMVWLTTAGCGGGEAVVAPRVDAAAAYRYAATVVAAGVRPSGSPALAGQADYIVATARQLGATAQLDEFEDVTPLGKLRFRNVVVTVPGRDTTHFVLIGCHYDTKRMFSEVRFVGANDGASGVGALLAMIEKTVKQPPPVTLRFVFSTAKNVFMSTAVPMGCLAVGIMRRNWSTVAN